MTVDMDMFPFYFSDTGASRSFTIMLGFLMNQRTDPRGLLKEVRPLRILASTSRIQTAAWAIARPFKCV